MELAISTTDSPIDYINAHGTSTPAGDIVELRAMQSVFADNCPKVSSTKSLSGHSLGAAGVQESIYTLLMMRDGFIAGSANIRELDEDVRSMPVVTESIDFDVMTAMSNSFGFGGTNATLIFKKLQA